MNLHEALTSDIREVIDALAGIDIISPTHIAREVQARYSTGGLEPHIEWASLEQLKQMARRALGGRFDADGDENPSHQGELFSNRLQTRYPTPRKRGDEPVYKLLGALTSAEVQWNVDTLRSSANARLLHADALAAWDQSRVA